MSYLRRTNEGGSIRAERPKTADVRHEKGFTDNRGGGDAAAALLGRKEPQRRGRAAILAAYKRIPTLRTVAHLSAQKVADAEWHAETDGEPDTEHEALGVLKQPNELQSGHDTRFLWQLYVDLMGEAFAIITEGDEGIELLTVPSTTVSRVEENGREMWEVEYNELKALVAPEMMLWIKEPDPANPMGRGSGLARALADELEIAEYASRYEKMEFANNARPDFMVFLPGAPPKEQKRVRQQWQDALRGPDNTGKGIFTGGPKDASMEFTEVSRKLRDMMPHDSRKLANDIISETFRTPPELIGRIENSNRATIENAIAIFAMMRTKPCLKRIRRALNQQLVPHLDVPDGFRFGFADPVPENREFRFQVAKEFPWAFTRNELRALADHPDRDGLDDVYTPTNATFAPSAGDVDTGKQVAKPEDDEASTPERKAPDNIIYLVEHKQSGELSPEEIAEALTPEYLRDETVEAYEDEVRQWYEIGAQGIGVSAEFNVVNPFIRDHVEQYVGDDIEKINATTKEQVRGIIQEGFDTGANPRDLIGAIDGLYLEQIIPNRSEVIARTEMLRASNFGTYQAHKVSGVVTKREWIGTPDGRARDWHYNALGGDLHGTVVKMNEDFVSPETGATGKYPGDFGTGKDDIQCRCTTAAKIPQRDLPTWHQKGVDLANLQVIVEGEESDEKRAEIWKRYEDERQKSEDRFRAVIADAFRKQRKDQLMPALREALGPEEAA